MWSGDLKASLRIATEKSIHKTSSTKSCTDVIFFLTDLPSSAFAGMSTLESLNLQHTQLRTIVLKEEVAHHLKLLEMEGNPLHCDCHTRWLWGLASAKDATAAPAESTDGGGGSSSLTSSNNRTDVRLPPCATPFSARGVPLVQLPGK